MALGQGQGLHRVGNLEHPVAGLGQDPRRHGANDVVVLHQQDRLARPVQLRLAVLGAREVGRGEPVAPGSWAVTVVPSLGAEESSTRPPDWVTTP